MAQKLIIRTSSGKFSYKIKEDGKKYIVSAEVPGGPFFTDYKEIGRAQSKEDAISIAKSHSPGSFNTLEFG